MVVSKSEVSKGIGKFLEQVVASNLDDSPALKGMILLIAKRFENSEDLIDKAMSNDIVRAILATDDAGAVDIDALETDVADTIESIGGIPITVPAIPLITGERTFTFYAQDVKELARLIRNS